MIKGLSFRIALSLVVLITALVYFLTCLPVVSNSPLAKYLPNTKINLGLDLKGGMHLTLGVDVDKAIESSLAQHGRDLISIARKSKVIVQKSQLTADAKLEFILLQADQKAALTDILVKDFPTLEILSSKISDNGSSLRYLATFTNSERKRLSDLILDQALKTIRNRIDQFGVSEPDIRKFSDSQRIQIQLPGLEDPERAVQLIGQTAHLEFRLVYDATKDNISPSAREALPYIEKNSGQAEGSTIVVHKESLISGESVADARQGFDQRDNSANVSIAFDTRGSALFERITEEYTHRRLAIVLDGKVYSAPNINEKIAGGKGSISGSFTVAEALDLALVLRAGSLPAPVTILEERNVGPSLGQESIDKGVNATLFSGVLILIFMGIYYRTSGLIANAMLLLDVVLLLAGMALFGATLTLPGIAGIVLTLGMAVDANILIFERIREELRRGETALTAVKEGFAKASITIIDSNLTTIIAAVILYQFGTGPIRGFAVTLCLGILASMFTSVYVAHICFDLWMGKEGRKLSI